MNDCGSWSTYWIHHFTNSVNSCCILFLAVCEPKCGTSGVCISPTEPCYCKKGTTGGTCETGKPVLKNSIPFLLLLLDGLIFDHVSHFKCCFFCCNLKDCTCSDWWFGVFLLLSLLSSHLPYILWRKLIGNFQKYELTVSRNILFN